MFVMPLFRASCAALALAGGNAQASTPQIYAFGDSLSDNGNLHAATGFPGYPYWQGRFSTGPVWVEQLAVQADLDPATIVDLAVGGATAGEVLALQIQPFVASGAMIEPDALVTLWAGANDLFTYLEAPSVPPDVLLSGVLQDIADSVVLLYGAGARRIVVPNLPDLSQTPQILALGDPSAIDAVQQLTFAFDAGHAQLVAALESALPGMDLVAVDTWNLFATIVSDPVASGFENVTQPAVTTLPDFSSRPARFLFWDGVHPTRRGHQAILVAAMSALAMPLADFNGSGAPDADDRATLLSALAAPVPHPAADIDKNGRWNRDDVDLMQLAIALW